MQQQQIKKVTLQEYQTMPEGFRAEFTNVTGVSLNSGIPEPESLALVVTALGSLGLLSRRRKST